ncbi:hypothetical protein [Labilibacter marinus]|uniref:hypothetical protein n=1 Tax=Labilibacter marinus TaxID=1477105 RepID=UPI00082AA4CE|nr:hypothetical protein [Labilibacter marinus]
MLEHQKKVLLGVSKNPHLFRKEVVKSLTWLSTAEAKELYNWVKKEFGSYYAQMLGEVFFGVSA